MLARFFVGIYRLVHGRLRLPGAGALLRFAARSIPGLQDFPLPIPGVGTARVDFRDEAAFSLLNFSLGERDNHHALLTLMERALPQGGVVWDVGANVGLVSAYLSRSAKRPSAIHAFEPVPAPRHTLQSLFAENPIVRVHPVGLGARDETLTIQFCPSSSSLNSLKRSLPGGESIAVEIRRGDSFRAQSGLATPHVLKVDVEGFEPEVFTGLAETIASARPAIFYEHIMLTDEQVRALTPPGYTLKFQLENGTLTEDFSRRMEGHNAVLVPPGQTWA
jgi:FkbM family methyltransferase